MSRGKSGSGVEVHNGFLRIRFTYNGVRYRESLGLTPSVANRKSAERTAGEVRNAIKYGTFDYAAMFPNSKNIPTPEAAVPVKTFREYAATWLDTLTGEKSTLGGYRTSIENFWLAIIVTHEDAEVQLGDLAITAVRHTHITTAIAIKAKAGITGKTTNNHLIPIRNLFEAAIADGLIEVSPLAKVKNRKHQKPPPDPFTAEEMTMIVAHMWEHYHVVIPAYFQFCFATGLRPSEAIALRWGDIDWNRRTVTVSRAHVRHQDKGTKTHNVRDVDLNDMAVAALTAMKPYTFMKAPNSPVFCSPEGKPWLSERRQREDFFHPALRTCGIRLRKAYNTRHTFATINLMAGVNPAYIASQLGHADTTMLFKHYAKWIRGADSGTEAAKSRAAFGAGPRGEMAPNWPRENIKPINPRG
jgi:integrase